MYISLYISIHGYTYNTEYGMRTTGMLIRSRCACCSPLAPRCQLIQNHLFVVNFFIFGFSMVCQWLLIQQINEIFAVKLDICYSSWKMKMKKKKMIKY